MIIYKDILTGDEIISDAYDLIESPTYKGMWEVNGRKMAVGPENIVLAGANPSAEGEDAEEGGDDTVEQKIDIVHQFRLSEVAKPTKKLAQADYKIYAKAVVAKLKELGKNDQAKDFQANAPEGLKAIMNNWDNFDVFQGESMGSPGHLVLVDYREDGVTPFALIWRYAVEDMKV